MAYKIPMMTKMAIGSLLVSTMLATSLPAQAQFQPPAPPPGRAQPQPPVPPPVRDRHRDDDGIDAGDVIAGAIVIGGLAAILSGASRDRDYRDESGYQDEWRRYGGSRRAIEQCVNAAEQRASRYGEHADVTRVTRVDRIRRGYEIRGEIKVDRRYGRDNRYGRNDRYARPDYADYGQFRCKVRNGQVSSITVSGLN